jgi:hypothetical protein
MIFVFRNNIIGIFSAPIVSKYADKLVKEGIAHGRELVVFICASITTLVFLLHSIPNIFTLHHSTTLLYFVGLRTIYSFSLAPIFPIVDGIALRQLSLQGIDQSAYGGERMYGAISWALISVFLGLFIDIIDTRVMYVFIAVFFFSLCGCLLLLSRDNSPTPSFSTTIHEKDNTHHSSFEYKNFDEKSALKTLIYGIASTPTYLSFVLLHVSLAMGTALVENLIFIYFITILGNTNFVCGISVVVTVLFEIPLLAKSQLLLEYFTLNSLMLISALFYVIRVLAYTMIPTGSHVLILLLIEPLHGITFACNKLAAVAYMTNIANEIMHVSCSPEEGNKVQGKDKRVLTSISDESNDSKHNTGNGTRDAIDRRYEESEHERGDRDDVTTISVRDSGVDESTIHNNSSISNIASSHASHRQRSHASHTNDYVATIQSVLSSFAALGKLVSVSLGGYVEEEYGSTTLYRAAGVLVLSASLLFWIVITVHDSVSPCDSKQGYSKQEPNQELEDVSKEFSSSLANMQSMEIGSAAGVSDSTDKKWSVYDKLFYSKN